MCQSDTSTRPDRIGSCSHGFRPQSGPTALTPKGEEIAANTFVAPYAFVEIVTLDPRTLAVLDRSTNYGHRKLTDEKASLTGIINGDNKEFLARQIVEVVQESTAEAMANEQGTAAAEQAVQQWQNQFGAATRAGEGQCLDACAHQRRQQVRGLDIGAAPALRTENREPRTG